MLTFSQFKKVILEALDEKEKASVDKWEKGDNSFSDHAFHGDSDMQRRSVELEHPEAKSEHHAKVEDHLSKHGFSVSDYKSGKAKDKYGREVNIGKALEKTKASDDIKKGFANDPSRQQQRKTSSSDLHVSFSRHPHDVAGMTSSGHSWENESCMNFKTGGNKHYLPHDVKHGTHIAYLSHKDDHDNSHPLARIALKKFTNVDDENDHILRPEDRTYGNAPDSFHHTVNNFLNHHFPGKEDAIYKKHRDVYDDSGNKVIIGKKALDRALTHKDYDVRMAALRHPDLTSDHIHKILDGTDNNAKSMVLRHPNLNAEHITKIMNSDLHHTLKQAAMRHRNATSEHIEKALKDPKLARIAIYHPNATKEQIGKALDHSDENIREGAARNPNATHEHITKALNDSNSGVRIAATNNHNANHEHLMKALDDENADVRYAATRNPNATHEHISKALNDSDPFIREGAITNRKANADHISKAMDDPSANVRETAIRHPNANVDHISKGLNDIHYNIRMAAAEHPNATREHLMKALNDKDTLVQKAAKIRLDKLKYVSK